VRFLNRVILYIDRIVTCSLEVCLREVRFGKDTSLKIRIGEIPFVKIGSRKIHLFGRAGDNRQFGKFQKSENLIIYLALFKTDFLQMLGFRPIQSDHLARRKAHVHESAVGWMNGAQHGTLEYAIEEFARIERAVQKTAIRKRARFELNTPYRFF
jgi:hypothetical protein